MSQFQKNRIFINIVGQFYKQIDGREEGEEIVIPDAQEAQTFWTDLWAQEVEHNKGATCIKEIKKVMNEINKQAQVQISQENLKRILKKVLNWKAPGPDWGQGFCLKNLTSLHKNFV